MLCLYIYSQLAVISYMIYTSEIQNVISHPSGPMTVKNVLKIQILFLKVIL